MEERERGKGKKKEEFPLVDKKKIGMGLWKKKKND